MAHAKQKPRSAARRVLAMATRGPLGTLVALLACLTAPALAEPVGTVTHTSGTVSVKRVDGSVRVLGLRSEVNEGDRITTERDTYTRVKFRDGGEVTLRPNTQVQVNNYSFKEAEPERDNMVISLFKGGMRALSGLIGKRNRDNVAFRTPNATIGIRGTNLGLLLCQQDCAEVPTIGGNPPADGLHLDVAEGAIVAVNSGGTVDIAVGQFGFVGGPGLPPVLVPPANGVRVTIPSGFQTGSSGRGVGVGGDSECAIQ